MCITRGVGLAGLIGLSLLLAPLLNLTWTQPLTPRVPVPARFEPLSRPHTPSEAAWQTARGQWMLAQEAVSCQIEALEEWDPEAANGTIPELWRRGLMAQDASGFLHRARQAAIQAQVLAHTPREAYRATLLRLRIEREGGHTAAELQLARRLVALAPESQTARWCLLHVMRDKR